MSTSSLTSEPTVTGVGSGARTGTLVGAILTTGLTAGVYVHWSNTIIPGLGTTDDRTFVEAARALDAAIVNPLFLGMGFVLALLLVAASLFLHFRAGKQAAVVWIGVALVCWVAMMAITFGISEPLNEELRVADAATGDADFAAIRARFDEATWATWNTVRAVVSTIACGCLVAASFRSRR